MYEMLPICWAAVCTVSLVAPPSFMPGSNYVAGSMHSPPPPQNPTAFSVSVKLQPHSTDADAPMVHTGTELNGGAGPLPLLPSVAG